MTGSRYPQIKPQVGRGVAGNLSRLAAKKKKLLEDLAEPHDADELRTLNPKL